MTDGQVKQSSGWVDQPGDYVNLLTFSVKNPDSLALGLVLLAYSIGLVQIVRGGQATCYVCGPQNRGADMPNYLYQ